MRDSDRAELIRIIEEDLDAWFKESLDTLERDGPCRFCGAMQCVGECQDPRDYV